jgi:hypothetical protein
MQYPLMPANIKHPPWRKKSPVLTAPARSPFAATRHSLLQPNQVFHPLDPVVEPRPIRRLFQLLCQSCVVVGLAGRVHESVGDRVALAEAILQEQIRGVDLARLVSCGGGRCLDALLEEALEVSLCWAELVYWPAGEQTGVVLADLLWCVSGHVLRWDVVGRLHTRRDMMVLEYVSEV